MTGQGLGTATNEFGTATCELRTVNHRGMKLSLRLGDALSGLQTRAETVIKSLVVRGSVWADVRWEPATGQSDGSVDWDLVAGYLDRLVELADSKGLPRHVELASLLLAPAVSGGGMRSRGLPDEQVSAVTDVVLGAIQSAGEHLTQMRAREGAAMATAIVDELRTIAQRVEAIASAAPAVVDRYEQRLNEKITDAMNRHGLNVPAPDLVREVQVFADRADINEELTRLGSHLGLFHETLTNPPVDGVGRKLEFVIQEINREVNTIGSKASDAAIATEVVEIKCCIERIRELVLNLE